ncbi:hypothetical protein BDR04DRAFT_1159314 [Suillus decipiens]|nr:hypothetical protein BDR04DRAFT_1159314 [Suillus decipiens]
MSTNDALVPSPTDRLTPAERKAFGKSDNKAAKILGITLTRNHVDQDGRLARMLSADQENPQVGNTLGEMMGLIGAKRARSRNSSAVIVFRPRKGPQLASGTRMDSVERNKRRRVAGDYTQRVILGPLRSNGPPVEEGEELPTTVSDDSACSFLEPCEIEETETPPVENNEEEGEDLFDSSRSFVWNVQNPFATPPDAVLQQYVKARRLGDTIGPFDIAPVASSCYTTPSPEEAIPALHSDDSLDDILRPAERAYLDFLIAQDEAEEQPREKRRQRRAAVRSRNKMLDVLGVEARQAIDGQC